MTAAALVVLAFWVLLLLDVKRWWPASLQLRDENAPPPRPGETPSLAVIIPARNEAEVLGETLPSLLAQSRSFSRLVLVDDRSADDTRSIAQSLAAASPDPGRILIVDGEPPLPGWTGKLYALERGISVVGESTEWLLFTDADIRHPPGSIDALLAKATGGERDLVSVMVKLRAETLWEKLLIPPFVWFFQLLFPFRRVADDRSRVAAAAGGCVLLRRRLLEKIGGLESIRGEIIDDVSLAARVKAAGGRCWLGFDVEMLSLRGYSTLGEIARMVARTAFRQLGYRYSLVLGTFLFLGIFFVAPPILAAAALLAGEPAGAAASALAWAIQSAAFWPCVRQQGVNALYALTLPAASVLYAYMTGLSAWRHLRGKGVEWKGRPVE